MGCADSVTRDAWKQMVFWMSKVTFGHYFPSLVAIKSDDMLPSCAVLAWPEQLSRLVHMLGGDYWGVGFQDGLAKR